MEAIDAKHSVCALILQSDKYVGNIRTMCLHLLKTNTNISDTFAVCFILCLSLYCVFKWDNDNDDAQ